MLSSSVMTCQYVDVRVMQCSALNSTHGLHNGQKDRKFSFPCLWKIAFITWEVGRSWESKDSGFLVGSGVDQGGASGMKRGGRTREINACTLLSNRHEGLLTRLPRYWPFGCRYPFPQAHRWRWGGLLWYEEGTEEEAKFFSRSVEGVGRWRKGCFVACRWWSELQPCTCLSIMLLKL